jgi:hypothetical protein
LRHGAQDIGARAIPGVDDQRFKDAAKLDEVTGAKQQSTNTMSLVATPGR